MPFLRLNNTIQPYAWGSHTVIAELTGRPSPSEKPEAELWMGAHPSAPSRAVLDDGPRSLLDLIQTDASGMLGGAAMDRFGSRLPFLLKVLAARTPLSLQAHPSREQAAQGFEKEERSGVPIDSPQRNYKDDNHKPELICALTPFDALCGFREASRTLELLRSLDVGALRPFIDAIAGSPGPAGLREAFQKVMSADREDIRSVVDATVRAAERREPSQPFSAECAWAVKIAALYPGDPGVVSALMLNLVRLEPGEALFLPAGNLHAYLGGAGIEIMANSDNVLRGGLTPKHVDVPELLSILDFRDQPAQRLAPHRASAAEAVYRTPAAEFQLSRIEVGRDTRFHADDRRGPEILLCTEGSANWADGTLDSGQSLFVTASEGSYELDGEGTVFRATLGAM